MNVEDVVGWLRAVQGFNDFELAPNGLADLEELLGARDLRDHVSPLGFHGSGSWVAMWRKDPATPWEDAAWVWVDSEGSPWEPFASSSKAALAALALDTGTLYDAVSSARSAAGDAAEEEAEAIVWEARTQQELSRAAERYPAQNEHRDRLAAKGIELPTNAFSVALEALARHGQFSAWLKQRSAEQAVSVDAGRSGLRKTAPKKASPKKASPKKASPKKASRKKASMKKAP